MNALDHPRVLDARRIVVGAAGLILVVPAILLGVWVALPA